MEFFELEQGALAKNYPKEEPVISIEHANRLLKDRSWFHVDETTGRRYRVIEEINRAPAPTPPRSTDEHRS